LILLEYPDFFKRIHNSDFNILPLEELYGNNIEEQMSDKIEEFNLERSLNDEKYCYFNSKRLYYYLAGTRSEKIKITKSLRRKNFNNFKHFSTEIYLRKFIANFTYFNYVMDYNYFNYFFINEGRKQTFVSILNEEKVSQLTYSTGLVLCALGFKKNNMYKTLKKQHKGFIKCFNYSKILIIPKLIKKFNRKENQAGIVITGRGKFTKNYAELPDYLENMNVKVIFLLWLPKLRFSFIKLKKYGRIKRNFRKRIVKTLMLSEKLKKKEIKN
jgi:hypothetical protein